MAALRPTLAVSSLMVLSRLSWRIGAPILLLVLVETVAIVLFLLRTIGSEQDERFEDAARRMASFVENINFDPKRGLANDLSRLTGFEVYLRDGGHIHDADCPPELRAILEQLPDNGRVQRHGDAEFVAAPTFGKGQILLRRRITEPLADPRVWQVLGAIWLLAGVITWIVVRRLGRPLRELATQLPHIDADGPLALDATGRRDEIGDVARAFVRTRQALQQERENRQRIEKLAVLGRMTAALAHEVQNPVAAIRMHAQLLRGSGHDDEATTIEQEAIRIEELLNQWLFLTRPEPPALGDLDLAAQLRTLVTAQRPRAEHAAVRLDLQVPPTLPVRGDGKRLQHVFRNLIDNAIQAMPSGGVLAIAATPIDGGGGAGSRVQVTFADRGRGFSPKALQHFTEFFFSEKEGGMGIGLSVAAEILKAHGGSLTAANRPDGGALVTVDLPTTPPAA
jgi:signal transduction histidine kinase